MTTQVKPKLPVLRLVKITNNSTFKSNVLTLGQSNNVVDIRGINDIPGTYAVEIGGYFTWYTWYHLMSQVPSKLQSALVNQGFNVFGGNVTVRDAANSQYNFRIYLRVLNQYSRGQVVGSVIKTLSRTAALPGSVRINYFKVPGDRIFYYD